MKTIAYSKSAAKTLKALPANVSGRIRAKIKQYATDPASLAQNVTQLVGSNYSRLRVGDWRVIFDEQGNVLNILKIAPRGSAYV